MNILGNINAIPFMRRRGGKGTPFPFIPGMICRYSAKGLTNEGMKTNPVWKDLMGNGYDLQMKNFGWAGMSGVGGYTESFSKIVVNYQSEINSNTKITITGGRTTAVNIRYNGNTFNSYIKVTGLNTISNETNGLLIYNSLSSSEKGFKCNTDGIYKVEVEDIPNSQIYIWLQSKTAQITYSNPITVEILPLYPGFILGDGVDDFAVTEKELNFEDTYTVYTAFIPFQDDPARNMILCGKNHTKDFYMNYSNLSRISFYSANKPVQTFLSNGFNLFCCKRNAENMTIKNLVTGKSVTATSIDLIDNPGLYFLWKSATHNFYSKAAIAGQTICNGYFSTDEDDEKVLNYYKKEYPWLFPDQAWTVTGKTNEDTDRATIANITGNGNNLVLSNFGFAEDSGYGLYGDDFFKWLIHENRVVATKTSKLFNITSIKEVVLQLYYQSTGGETVRTIPSYTIKVTGLTDGQKILYKNNQTDLVSISSDGIHKLPSFEFLGAGSYYGFAFTKVQESCDITIEQIPEYEGYLVTDGVDDKIISSNFKFGENYTVVGEWKFLQEASNVVAGFLKNINYWVLYNYKGGISTYIKQDTQGTFISGVHSIKAISSKGEVYPDFNSYVKIESGKGIETNNPLYIGFNPNVSSNNFTKLAFKNLAIYLTVLSKEDCIKAYNYLQTLKTK